MISLGEIMENNNNIGLQVFSAIILAAIVIFWGPAIFWFYSGLLCLSFMFNWPTTLIILMVITWVIRREFLRDRTSSK